MTHLHLDHASAISDFPAATFLLSRGRVGGGDRAARRSCVATWRQFDHAFDYRLLDFDGSQSESFASFGRSFDVFGDGSVRLVYTPGHTRGHLSVMLRLAAREALIAGDAIYTLRTLRDSALPHRMTDEHLFRRSLREIQLYAEQTPDALIVPGHDMTAWRRSRPGVLGEAAAGRESSSSSSNGSAFTIGRRRSRPVLEGTVALQLDAVAVEIAQVDRERAAVILGAVDRMAVIEQPLRGPRQRVRSG